MQEKTKQVHVIIIGFEIHISDTISNKGNSCGQACVRACVRVCVKFLTLCLASHLDLTWHLAYLTLRTLCMLHLLAMFQPWLHMLTITCNMKSVP